MAWFSEKKFVGHEMSFGFLHKFLFLLNVRLSIILAIDQLNAQILVL